MDTLRAAYSLVKILIRVSHHPFVRRMHSKFYTLGKKLTEIILDIFFFVLPVERRSFQLGSCHAPTCCPGFLLSEIKVETQHFHPRKKCEKCENTAQLRLKTKLLHNKRDSRSLPVFLPCLWFFQFGWRLLFPVRRRYFEPENEN